LSVGGTESGEWGTNAPAVVVTEEGGGDRGRFFDSLTPLLLATAVGTTARGAGAAAGGAAAGGTNWCNHTVSPGPRGWGVRKA